MSTMQTPSAGHRFRHVLQGMWAGMTDGELLEAFIAQRDEAPFEVLIERHGPMVWGLCRRFLHNQHDAEDAFQAVFLVFLRKAATIRPRDRVGNWLYGVARQTALDARAMVAKRNQRETHPAQLPEPAVLPAVPMRDELGLLDQELCRLPAKYRSVIVLCELEGLTVKLAAKQLAVPEGTVAGWLARAKAMLAKRLTRYRIALSAGALALLAGNAAHASVPQPLAASTRKLASLDAAGREALAVTMPNAVALSNGVLTTMLIGKCKAVAVATLAMLLCICLVLDEGQSSSNAGANRVRFALTDAAPALEHFAEQNKPTPVGKQEPRNE